jgi:hypothetical protein
VNIVTAAHLTGIRLLLWRENKQEIFCLLRWVKARRRSSADQWVACCGGLVYCNIWFPHRRLSYGNTCFSASIWLSKTGRGFVVLFFISFLMRPIHDQSCCAKLFCATQVCPFTIKSISTIHGLSCCTIRNVAQHDWSCMGPLCQERSSRLRTARMWIWGTGKRQTLLRVREVALCILQISVQNWASSISAYGKVNSFSKTNSARWSRIQFRIVQSDRLKECPLFRDRYSQRFKPLWS